MELKSWMTRVVTEKGLEVEAEAEAEAEGGGFGSSNGRDRFPTISMLCFFFFFSNAGTKQLFDIFIIIVTITLNQKNTEMVKKFRIF